jgi:electron transport complex protein RnfB
LPVEEANRFPNMISLAEKIDALLPQTQCTQCGYDGCKPYAKALAENRANINQCPPGGEPVIRSLAVLLQTNFIPLNPQFGVSKPRAIAAIDENLCIGCTLCIKACPVDAIVGATKQMHTVIKTECTGCELCLAPCPVDCIVMLPPTSSVEAAANPALWRRRHESRLQRLKRDKQEKTTRLAQRSSRPQAAPATPDRAHQSPAVSAAIRHARARQAATKK